MMNEWNHCRLQFEHWLQNVTLKSHQRIERYSWSRDDKLTIKFGVHTLASLFDTRPEDTFKDVLMSTSSYMELFWFRYHLWEIDSIKFTVMLLGALQHYTLSFKVSVSWKMKRESSNAKVLRQIKRFKLWCTRSFSLNVRSRVTLCGISRELLEWV